jgi:hypothetical protein
MDEATRQSLLAELGEPLPAGLDTLDDAEAREFAVALADANARQSTDLDEAIDKALKVLPPGIRTIARKLLIG